MSQSPSKLDVTRDALSASDEEWKITIKQEIIAIHFSISSNFSCPFSSSFYVKMFLLFVFHRPVKHKGCFSVIGSSAYYASYDRMLKVKHRVARLLLHM